MLNAAPGMPDSATLPQAFAALHAEVTHGATPLRQAITDAYRKDEPAAVQWLLSQAVRDNASSKAAQDLARHLMTSLRTKRVRASGVDALMHEFSLSSEEGIALMCLAEALLRIPDPPTADRLIADKISKGNWRKHLGESPSLFVNAATWGLLITGKLVGTSSEQGLGTALTRLITKGGEPLIRKGVDLAMRMLGNQFVTGQTIEEALANSREREARGYRYSYDMLGEAALTQEDAVKYYAAYEKAIHAIGRKANGRGIKEGPGISVKLSALHPRYSRSQRGRVMRELLPRLKALVMLAKQYQIGLNIDAEEADRLELSLDLMEALAFDPELAGFDGIGFVVQAYQKRCPFVIDYLADLARRSGRKFMVRLVKGAYWDAEIKRSQVEGMPSYPVYTRKVYTDVSYLTCAQKLLELTAFIYPQFATHNAHSLSMIYTWAKQRAVTDYEFQCLHGMGEGLYDEIVGSGKLNRPCRIYAPVGSHETLLPYLVRRLLENGANSSFVNQIVDENIPIDTLIEDPFEKARHLNGEPHPNIPLPRNLFGVERKNSAGLDLSNETELRAISTAFEKLGMQQWYAAPLLAEPVSASGHAQIIHNPAHGRDGVGYVIEATEQEVEHALASACAHARNWENVPATERASLLEHAAELLEEHRLEFMALAIREAGKSLPNAIGEVREAVDFLRYYAARITKGLQGEALGPVVCISPWNFPLAIFIGEVSAALAAGNVVLAKPAEQTPLIAHRAVELLHQAGVPRAALQFLPGHGETVGAKLVADPRVRGVIFTGSTEVAQIINRVLAKRMVEENIDLPLIAETGGQNAMIVDSSALPEQVVQDVVASAFDSAGQRCSALRVLCLQNDIADKTLSMLKGAMRELHIGNPDRLAIDIGPVIDQQAQQSLVRHIERMRLAGKQIFQLPLPPECEQGTFVSPTLIEIDSMAELQHEVFGPVLHVLRYERNTLPQVIQAINATGYGLTQGIHSRVDETIDYITAHAEVGNIYVNRNMIGAVVGVQPFGGEGKSGTGPKAGGPLYLKRLRHHADDILDGYASKQQVNVKNSEVLGTLLMWMRDHGYASSAALAEQAAKNTLLPTSLTMPGPTGERNTLWFAPRGVALCETDSRTVLLNQLAACFATQNQVLLTSKTAALLPEDIPANVRNALRVMVEADSAAIPLDVVLIDRADMPRLLPLLARREGALIPVIMTSAQTIPLWRLVLERAICVNTSAAGGNASLMTLDG